MPPDDDTIDADLGPHFWSFVYAADIVAPSLATVVLPAAQAPLFIGQTVFINPTIVVRSNDHVVVANPGIAPAIIAARIGHPLQTVAVEPQLRSASTVRPASERAGSGNGMPKPASSGF